MVGAAQPWHRAHGSGGEITMAESVKKCPSCEQADLVFKARQLYLESLAKLKDWDTSDTPELNRFLKESGNDGKPKNETRTIVRDLVHQFEPPSGKPQLLRTLSPNLVMTVFGAVSVFFLYQIYFAQRPIFWFMVAVFVVLYASFFIFHKTIMTRFQSQKSMDTTSVEVIQKAIGKWMKTSYCLRDNMVFGFNKDETAPLEELTRRLIMACLPEKDGTS
jgi:cation transport ATPase